MCMCVHWLYASQTAAWFMNVLHGSSCCDRLRAASKPNVCVTFVTTPRVCQPHMAAAAAQRYGVLALQGLWVASCLLAAIQGSGVAPWLHPPAAVASTVAALLIHVHALSVAGWVQPDTCVSVLA